MGKIGVMQEYLCGERDYEYETVCGSISGEYPPYYKLSDEFTGTQKDQGYVSACVAETITSIAEAWWNRNLNVQDEHSEGFAYGAFREKTSTYEGLYVSRALSMWKEIGTIPKRYFDILEEMPEIKDIVARHPEFLDIAKNYRLSAYTKLKDSGSSTRDQQVKDAILKYNYGLVSVYDRHCVQLVGWDDDKDVYIYKDSYGSDEGDNGYKTKKKSSFSEIWLPIFEEVKLPFEDVSEKDWFFDAIRRLYFSGVIKGKTETSIAPNDYITRAEVFALLDRHISKDDEDRKILNKIINEKIQID